MIKVTSYEDLQQFITKFKEGYFDLLIIQSRGGLGKTYSSNSILNGTVLKINSHMTPLGLYEAVYQNRDKNIWMDDVENLFTNDKTVGICKQLCETHPEKEICYLTSWNLKKTRKIPKRFMTSAKVMMTINSIQRTKNLGINALLDRGIMLDFSPSPREMGAYIQRCFDSYDKEIIQFLSAFKVFSLRDYIKCSQLKSAGFQHWRQLYIGKEIQVRKVVKKIIRNSQSKNGRPEIQYSPEIEDIILKHHRKGWSSRRIRDKVLQKTGEWLCFNTIIKFIKRKKGQYQVTRVDKKAPVPKEGQEKAKEPLKDPEYNPPEESRKVSIPSGHKKKYKTLEKKRKLNNTYMVKIRSQLREHREASQCIYCGALHFNDDDLCPDCQAATQGFNSELTLQ